MHTVIIRNNTPKDYKELEAKVIKSFAMENGDAVQFKFGDRTKPYTVPAFSTKTKGWWFWEKSTVTPCEIELTKGSLTMGKYEADENRITINFGG